MVMRLIDKSAGAIIFDDVDIGEIPPSNFAKLPLRRRIQLVFQDPTDSLNPRFTAARAIADPILRLGDVKRAGCARAVKNWHDGLACQSSCLTVSPSALGWPESACRHCARDRAQTRPRDP